MSQVRSVLMTTDTVGGVWHYSVGLCRALCARGVRVTLASMGGPVPTHARDDLLSLNNFDLRESSYRLEWMDEPWSDVDAAGEWLQGIAHATSPDVVHLNGYAHAVLDFDAPVIVVAHSCVASWWAAVHGTPLPSRWDTYVARVTRGLRAASHVIAPTAAMLASLERHYGALPSSEVVANGTDAEHGRGSTKEPMILAAGRFWDEAKNIRAIAAVARRAPWPTFLAGTLGGAMGSDASVRTLGVLDRRAMNHWLSRASIFLHPARYEPFGLAVLEAACAGCALVLGDIPTLREVWDDAACFADPCDEDALAQAVDALASDSSRRAEFATRAKRRSGVFRLDRMVDAYVNVYERLVAAA